MSCSSGYYTLYLGTSGLNISCGTSNLSSGVVTIVVHCYPPRHLLGTMNSRYSIKVNFNILQSQLSHKRVNQYLKNILECSCCVHIKGINTVYLN